MDILITTWEMSLEPASNTIVREEVATGPLEPYVLDRDGLFWN